MPDWPTLEIENRAPHIRKQILPFTRVVESHIPFGPLTARILILRKLDSVVGEYNAIPWDETIGAREFTFEKHSETSLCDDCSTIHKFGEHFHRITPLVD